MVRIVKIGGAALSCAQKRMPGETPSIQESLLRFGDVFWRFLGGRSKGERDMGSGSQAGCCQSPIQDGTDSGYLLARNPGRACL